MPRTEGIFSSELDLRDLQKTGKVGRIKIEVTTQGDKTKGIIVVPTGLDRSTTALIAAMIESVDRVGPYASKVTIEKLEDVRNEKRRRITERARTLLYEWEKKKIPRDDEAFREIEGALVKARIVEYGPERLPAGPEVKSANELIIVEGRADVNNLLRYGYNNAIAVEGAKIPKAVEELSRKKKKVTAFLDGDHAGDLILRELFLKTKVDFVVRAPRGKEVEELTSKEIAQAFDKPTPSEEARKELKKAVVEEKELKVPDAVKEVAKEIEGTLLSAVFDENLDQLERIPVSELAKKLKEIGKARFVIFDGVVTQRLVDIAAGFDGDVYLIGARTGKISNKPKNVRVLTNQQLSPR